MVKICVLWGWGFGDISSGSQRGQGREGMSPSSVFRVDLYNRPLLTRARPRLTRDILYLRGLKITLKGLGRIALSFAAPLSPSGAERAK